MLRLSIYTLRNASEWQCNIVVGRIISKQQGMLQSRLIIRVVVTALAFAASTTTSSREQRLAASPVQLKSDCTAPSWMFDDDPHPLCAKHAFQMPRRHHATLETTAVGIGGRR